MALTTIARRFQRMHSSFLLPSILKSPTSHHVLSSPVYSRLSPSLFRDFHQTPSLPSSQTIHEVQSPALHPSPNSHLYQTINVNHLIDDSHGHNRLEVSKLLKLISNGETLSSEGETTDFLDDSGIKPNATLINSVVWALRDKWKLAFLAFKWGEKWGCTCDKNWSLMIWVLGNHKKFNTAWCLIRDLCRSSVDTQQAMFIMIDRYAAANDPEEAIHTFQIMEKFKHSPDQKAFYRFLDILCKHGNVEEAEEFMYLNKKLFPLETEGFNIILRGWCEISIDILEAKRVWREMAKCCILPNAPSYTHMISCHSKVGNLFDSLRLYDEMNKREWVPGREVYNSLIYVLARENCLKEALKMVDKMKEKGLNPDAASYNSIICPLCEAGKVEDARTILATMAEENVNPTIETYHAFLEGGWSFEGTTEILNHMAKAGLGPRRHTFCIIISKLLKSNQPENALKIWVDMKNYKVTPDSGLYTLMVDGLIRSGLLVKAREIYAEMVSNGNMDDPKLKKLLNEPAKEGTRKKGKWRKRYVKHFKKGTQERHANRDKQSRTNGKCSVNSNPLKLSNMK